MESTSSCKIFIYCNAMALHLLLLCSFLLIPTNSATIDYFWRDFTGEIPDDAVPGGSDTNNKTTYIAQVYIPNHGVLPTRLYENQKHVTVSRVGVHTSDKFIQILCSQQPEKLSWMSTSSGTLHVDTIGKHLVVGGTENNKILNVGRAAYKDEVIVGKVCGYNIGDAQLYFPYGKEEVGTTSYEVLVYEDSTIDGIVARIGTF